MDATQVLDEGVITSLIVLPIFFATILLGVKYWFDWKRTRLKSEIHHKLLNKFDNVKELNQFLESENGSEFLGSLTIENVNARDRLLAAVSRGVVTLIAGLALLVIGFWQVADATGQRLTLSGAILLIFLGIGFLVSAVVSYRLSQQWGLIEKK